MTMPKKPGKKKPDKPRTAEEELREEKDILTEYTQNSWQFADDSNDSKRTSRGTGKTVSVGKASKKPKPKASEWLSAYKLQLLTVMAATGMSMKALAKEIGISEPTLKKWRDENPEIDAAIQRGEKPADDRMECELYQNATDRYAVEDTVEYLYNDAGEKVGERVIRRQYKHIKADTTAQIFYLCNRRPDVWRDIRSVAKTAEGADIESSGGVVILPETDAPPDETDAESASEDSVGGEGHGK